MKASELRLGNLVNVPRKDQSPFRIDAFESLSNSFIKVAMIHPEHGEKFHPLTWYGDDLKPIPLTEEWLLKFGFEKFVYDSEETGYGTEYKLKASEDVFMVYSDDFSLGLYSDESREENDMAVIPTYEHIKHVHQLQNLYFALTGEELTQKSS